MKIDKENFKFLFPTITAFIGIIIGSLLNAYTSDKLYYDKLNAEQQVAFFNARLQQIEKTTKIVAKLPAIKEQFDYHFNSNSLIKDSLILIKNLAISERLAEYRSDFFSILTMDKLYFGNKTAKEIDSFFNKNKKEGIKWWNAKEESFEPLINSMYEELFLNLTIYQKE